MAKVVVDLLEVVDVDQDQGVVAELGAAALKAGTIEGLGGLLVLLLEQFLLLLEQLLLLLEQLLLLLEQLLLLLEQLLLFLLLFVLLLLQAEL